MIILVLTHFDALVGPKIFFHAPDSIGIEDLDSIPILMDLYESGFFIHISENNKTANLIFNIKSEYARGNLESLLISIVVENDYEINLTLTRELVEGFAKEVNGIKFCFKAFYLESHKYKGDINVFSELKHAFLSFYKSLKPAIKALREAEVRYRELVENVNSIILKWDFNGKILFLNQYGERFFGYDNEELKGRHVIGTIVPKTESSGRDLQKFIEEICANPDRFEKNQNENITKEGKKVHILWSNKGLRDEKGNLIGILSVGHDLT